MRRELFWRIAPLILLTLLAVLIHGKGKDPDIAMRSAYETGCIMGNQSACDIIHTVLVPR